MAESQLEAILAATVLLLAGVPGVQRVYDYEPVATEAGQIPSVMGTSQEIHYWSVCPETSAPDRLPGFQVEDHHVLVLRGYISVGEVAQSTRQVRALIQAIRRVFDLVFSIEPAAEMTGPLQTTWPRHLRLAETFLVHGIELRLPVRELYVVQ